MCDMTRSYVQHDSFTCVTRFIHVCNISRVVGLVCVWVWVWVWVWVCGLWCVCVCVCVVRTNACVT